MGTQASSQLGSEDIDHRSYSPTYRFIIFRCRRFQVRFSSSSSCSCFGKLIITRILPAKNFQSSSSFPASSAAEEKCQPAKVSSRYGSGGSAVTTPFMPRQMRVKH